MIGAVAGDVIGSVFELSSIKTTEFPLFSSNATCTDDSILTIAVADCILNGKDYAKTIKEYGRDYPYRGYGGMFLRWLASDSYEPYNSFGNGSAMRVSPVGFAFNSLDEVLVQAEKSASVTHNHPEGINGAQAVASAIFLARTGNNKNAIREYIESTFEYDLSQKLSDIRPSYRFDETCQGSVPQSIIAFLESDDYEDAIRKSISLGGDSDTMACITGGIAQAYYKTRPDHIVQRVRGILPAELLNIVDSFNEMFLVD
ncbi:ADP-ribosylglycohydrolase family protein [Chloroflexota bacterium]